MKRILGLTTLSILTAMACAYYWRLHSIPYHLSILGKSSTDTLAQVFFDTGNGYNQAESSRVSVHQSNTFQELVFSLPLQRINHLRLDPLMSEGSLEIQRAIISASRGILHEFDLGSDFVTVRDIDQSISPTGTLIAVAPKDSLDPIMELQLAAPLDHWGIVDLLDGQWLRQAVLLSLLIAPLVLAFASKRIELTALVVAYAAAVAAPSVILWKIGQASRMQFQDYWHMLAGLTRPDGSFNTMGLFVRANEHWVVIPKLTYLANIFLTGGSNRALGVLCLAMVVTQIVVLRQLLPDTVGQDKVLTAVCVAAMSVLLLSPHGIHNFTFGMSGTAWLGANLFAVSAIFAHSRRHPLWATVLAVVASFTYTTGMLVWPVLAVLSLRDRRRGLVFLSSLPIGFGVFVAALLTYKLPPHHAAPSIQPLSLLATYTEAAGALLTNRPYSARIAGVLVALAMVFLSLRALRMQRTRLHPWIGIGVYSMFCIATIAVGRGGFATHMGMSSRYASLPALLWIAIIVLSAALMKTRRAFVLLVILVCGASIATSSSFFKVDARMQGEQAQLAIAARLGAAEGYPRFGNGVVPILKSLGHYPFNDDFEYDCGLIGTRLAKDQIRVDAAQVDGSFDVVKKPINKQANPVAGWVIGKQAPIRCVILVDDELEVVGAAQLEYPRRDVNRALKIDGKDFGWHGVAFHGGEVREIRALAMVQGDDKLYSLQWPHKIPQ